MGARAAAVRRRIDVVRCIDGYARTIGISDNDRAAVAHDIPAAAGLQF